MTPTSVAGAYDHVWHWYDAEGRRVLSKVHQADSIGSPDPLSAGGPWTYYIHDGSDVALTLVGGPPGGVGTAWRVQGRYVSVGVDQPIAGRFWVDGAGDPVQPLALIADRQGSTIRALKPDGSRETRTMYFQRDAFGALEDAMGQAGGELNPGTGFTGASTPTQTGGFTYLRNRWYDPATGRFLTQDPIGLAGGVNLYAYAGNNPVSFSDPFGLSPCCFIGLIDPAGALQPPPPSREWVLRRAHESAQLPMMLVGGAGLLRSGGRWLAGRLFGRLARGFGGAAEVAAGTRSIGNQIAGGHAFVKHIREFDDLGIVTQEQFAKHIDDVVQNASGQNVRELVRGRTAYWDGKSGTVVIKNARAADGGTAFRPTNGREYFENLK